MTDKPLSIGEKIAKNEQAIMHANLTKVDHQLAIDSLNKLIDTLIEENSRLIKELPRRRLPWDERGWNPNVDPSY